MKKPPLLPLLAGTLIGLLAAALYFNYPSNYEQCIIAHIDKAHTTRSAQLIDKACKYPGRLNKIDL